MSAADRRLVTSRKTELRAGRSSPAKCYGGDASRKRTLLDKQHRLAPSPSWHTTILPQVHFCAAATQRNNLLLVQRRRERACVIVATHAVREALPRQRMSLRRSWAKRLAVFGLTAERRTNVSLAQLKLRKLRMVSVRIRLWEEVVAIRPYARSVLRGAEGGWGLRSLLTAMGRRRCSRRCSIARPSACGSSTSGRHLSC